MPGETVSKAALHKRLSTQPSDERILQGLSPQQWERTVRRESVKRVESVYFSARGLCAHEFGHLENLAGKLGRPLSP